MTKQNFELLVNKYPAFTEDWQAMIYLIKTKEPNKTSEKFYRAILIKKSGVFVKLSVLTKIQVWIMAQIGDLLGFRI